MKHLIKFFWKLTSKRFLLQEFHDHTNLLVNYELREGEQAEIENILDTYIIPEMTRRGL